MSGRSILRSGLARFRAHGKDDSAGPGPAAQDAPLCRLSTLSTLRPAAMGAGRNCAVKSGPLTFVEIWNAESSFNEVRLIFGSTQGGTNFGVTRAIVAPTSAAGFSPYPVDAGGQRVPFQTVTFEGSDEAGSLRFPAISDRPEGQHGWTPQLSFSDFVRVSSVPRSDGGPGCLLTIRTHIDGSQRSCGPYTAKREGDCSDTSSVTGRVYQKTFGPGDLVTGFPDAGTERLDPGAVGHGFVYAVQFRSDIPGATVQAVGDSILQGAGFTAVPGLNGHISFAHLACAAVSTPERPVTLLQGSVGGEPSADFYRSALEDLRCSDVAIALIQTWSGNDIRPDLTKAECQLVADAAWGRAMHYAERVQRQGGVSIFLSAVPQAPKMWCPGAEDARMSSVTRCAELAERGAFVLDMNGILGDGGHPAHYKPHYDAGDDIHPNTAANHAITEILAPMIRTIIGAGGGGLTSL